MRIATGYNGTTRTLEELQRWSHWVQLDAETQRRVLALLVASSVAGRPLGIGSIFRSEQQQLSLFLSRHEVVASGGCCSYEGRRYKLRADMAHAAPPRRSYHEATTALRKALAIDFTGDLGFLRENAAAYGLVEFSRVNSEPWHGQPSDVPQSRTRYSAAIHEPLKPWNLPSMPPPAPTKITVPVPTLRQGALNDVEQVRSLQHTLNFWGWRDAMNRTLIVDGDYGQKTTQAVIAMQRALNQTQDGVYGSRTAGALQAFVDAMTFAPESGRWGLWPSVAKETIRLGSSGDAVRYLQGVLKLKANQTPVVINGQFDQTTNDAVRIVQKFLGLTVDGIVGPKTWAAIDYLAGT